MLLTQTQIDMLKLIARSPDSGSGWRECAPKIFDHHVIQMPDELVEKDIDQRRARLTDAGSTLAKWIYGSRAY